MKIRLQNSVIWGNLIHVMRDEFTIKPISVNGRTITKVIVDPHVRKHPDVTDDMILDLVRQLDGGEFRPEDIKPPFEYFVTLEYLAEKQYRMVWLLEQDEIYIGVITVYRDERNE
jgi:hypothetical protein